MNTLETVFRSLIWASSRRVINAAPIWVSLIFLFLAVLVGISGK